MPHPLTRNRWVCKKLHVSSLKSDSSGPRAHSKFHRVFDHASLLDEERGDFVYMLSIFVNREHRMCVKRIDTDEDFVYHRPIIETLLSLELAI